MSDSVSDKKLVAYATVGKYAMDLCEREKERLNKIKGLVNTLSDDEFEQLVNLSKELGDLDMVENLNKWRNK
jgi:hypothetical protein